MWWCLCRLRSLWPVACLIAHETSGRSNEVPWSLCGSWDMGSLVRCGRASGTTRHRLLSRRWSQVSPVFWSVTVSLLNAPGSGAAVAVVVRTVPFCWYILFLVTVLYRNHSVICEVFSVGCCKIMVSMNVMPCSLLDGCRYFGANFCLQLQVLAWKWSQHIPRTHWYPYTMRHSVIYLKIILITIVHLFLCLGLSVLIWDYVWVLATFEARRTLDGKKMWYIIDFVWILFLLAFYGYWGLFSVWVGGWVGWMEAVKLLGAWSYTSSSKLYPFSFICFYCMHRDSFYFCNIVLE